VSALNNMGTTTALSSSAITFNIANIAGSITYNNGIFNLDNTASSASAIFLVTLCYSSWGSELDSGNFTIEVSINSGPLNQYGNTINASNGFVSGGASTTIVIVPATQIGQLIIAANGNYYDNEISLTIVQIN